MEGREALLTLAEFSIALAGFTGVIVIFGRRDEDWHPIDSFRIQVVLWASIGPAFLSLASIGLDMLACPDPRSGELRACSSCSTPSWS